MTEKETYDEICRMGVDIAAAIAKLEAERAEAKGKNHQWYEFLVKEEEAHKATKAEAERLTSELVERDSLIATLEAQISELRCRLDDAERDSGLIRANTRPETQEAHSEAVSSPGVILPEEL